MLLYYKIKNRGYLQNFTFRYLAFWSVLWCVSQDFDFYAATVIFFLQFSLPTLDSYYTSYKIISLKDVTQFLFQNWCWGQCKKNLLFKIKIYSQILIFHNYLFRINNAHHKKFIFVNIAFYSKIYKIPQAQKCLFTITVFQDGNVLVLHYIWWDNSMFSHFRRILADYKFIM